MVLLSSDKNNTFLLPQSAYVAQLRIIRKVQHILVPRKKTSVAVCAFPVILSFIEHNEIFQN